MVLKKIARWSLWSAAGCMLLVVLLHFLLPLLLDKQALKSGIKAHLASQLPGSIDFAELRIALLPLPAVSVRKVVYILPGQVQLQAEKVDFRPHLPALLRGRLRLASLTVMAPNAVIELPDDAARKRRPASGTPWDALLEGLPARLARLPQEARVRFEQGRVTLQQGAEPVSRMEKLEFTLVEHKGHLNLDLRGGSDCFTHFQVTAQLDAVSLDGRGEIELNGICLDALADGTLSRPVSGSIKQIEGDLHLTFETQGLRRLQAHLRTALPSVTLAGGSQWVRARQISVEADVALAPREARVTLSRLHMEQPCLTLDGILVWNGNDPGDTALQLDAHLSETDVTGLRAGLITLAGKGRAWKLWDIVRGGILEEMTLHASGGTWRDLGRLKNLHIAGKATRGYITVPGAQLDLADIYGTWKLEEAVLTVSKGAWGRYGGIRAGNVALSVGLAGPPHPIDLDLDFKADLADLPALLKKVIASDKTQAELSHVGSAQGRASGHLRLNGTLQKPRVRVTAKNVALTARYDRLPLPLQIRVPKLVYTDGQIRFTDMNAAMGTSSLTALTGRVAWQPAPELVLQSRTARLAGEEIFPWLKGIASVGDRIASLESIEGILELTDLTFTGPPAQVDQWQVGCTGALNALSIRSTRLSEPFNLSNGRFSLGMVPNREKALSQKRQELQLDVQQLLLACADQRAALSGTIRLGPREWEPHLVLSSERLDLGRLVPLFKNSSAQDSSSASRERGAHLDGRVSVSVGQLVYGSYLWDTVRAEASLTRERTTLEVNQADLCGISTVGRIVWNEQEMRLEVKSDSRGESIRYTGGCLMGSASSERIEGTLAIQGALVASGRNLEEVLASLAGEVRLGATDGRIFNIGRVGPFTNLLSFLSINNVVNGEGLNLTRNDLPYKRIDLVLLIHGGVAELREATITTKPLNLVGEGRVDLKTLDTSIVLLVSPLTAADALVKRIPIIGKIFQGTLVAIPVEVKGSLNNPIIRPLSPKAVGTRLLGIMERTVMAPLQLVEPIWRTPEVAPGSAP